MQGVKADAATRGIIYGVGDKVVEVDQHGCHHNRITEFPVMTVKQGDHNGGNDKMQADV